MVDPRAFKAAAEVGISLPSAQSFEEPPRGQWKARENELAMTLNRRIGDTIKIFIQSLFGAPEIYRKILLNAQIIYSGNNRFLAWTETHKLDHFSNNHRRCPSQMVRLKKIIIFS